MTDIYVSVACDSRSEEGHRLTSLLVEVPRPLVPYILRCRVLSRAMQMSHRMSYERAFAASDEYPPRDLMQLYSATRQAHLELRSEVPAPELNVILEPFQQVTMLLTSTSWGGLTLANEEDKQWGQVQALASAVRAAIRGSEPALVPLGGWHMPLLLPADFALHSPAALRQVSAVRCDALEYLGHDQELDDSRVRIRYKEITESQHPRALEHVASPAHGQHGNFLGWLSLRESLEAPPKDKRIR